VSERVQSRIQSRSKLERERKLVHQIRVGVAVVLGSVVRIRAIDDVLDRLTLERHELLDDLLKVLVRVFGLLSRQTPDLGVDAVVDHQAPQRASLDGGGVDELDVVHTGEKQLFVDGGDDLVDDEIGGGEV